MRLADLEFLVKIGENTLEEYEVTARGNEAACWIASEAGKVRTNMMYILDRVH